jgi:ornithine lipid ester-linked acyl 2-hydroxylase
VSEAATARQTLGVSQRLVDLTVLVGEWVLDRLDRLVARFSRVGDPAFFTHEQFLWAYGLDANWRTIRAELDRVLEHRDALPNFQDISTDQESITDDDRWKTFFLYGFGFRSDTNCELCPETARLVAAVPGMKTAMFSILSPGKHIPEHNGPYKGVIRYHLALKVPEPRERCRIRVGDEIVTWTEGESLLFDDTYEHEVWNDTDGERVVLFLDVVRPLRFPMNLVNAVVLTAIAYSPFVADAKRRHLAWEARFAAHRDRLLPTITGRAPTQLAARRARDEAGRDQLHDVRG